MHRLPPAGCLLLLFLTLLLGCNRAGESKSITAHPESAVETAAAIKTAETVETVETDAARFGLKGQVRRWTRQSFRVASASGKTEKILLNKEVYTFDRAGRQTRVEGYRDRNALVSAGVTEYNAAGKISRQEYYAAGKKKLAAIDYIYNAEAKLLAETKTDLIAGLIYHSRWEYNPQGQPLRFEKYMQDAAGASRLLTRILYRYDDRQRLQEQEQTEYKTDGTINFRRIVQYRDDGSVKQSCEYDAANELTRREKNRYDDAGRLLESLETIKDFEDGTWLENTTAYQYDTTGNLVKHTEPGRTVSYTYTADGKPEEITTYDYYGKPVKRILHAYTPENGGHEEMQVFYGEDGTITNRYLHAYDAAAKLIAWARYDGDGALLYRHPVHYDAGGNKTEEVKEEARDYPPILYKYAYDARGNHIRTDCYRLESNGEKLLVMTYEYGIVYW